MINLKKNYALILALGLILTGCTGQTGTDETKATQTQEMTTSGTEETVDTLPSADITTVDVQTTENKTEEDTTAVKETTDQETESEEESTAEETTAEEPTAEESEEPTAEEETTPETTAEPTTAEPTTPEPTTAEPTTPEPTTPEPTTAEPTTVAPTKPPETKPVETTPAVVAKSITGSVNGTHYIGDNLSAADFTITVTMSDGSKLTNPAGFAVSPLNISSATTTFTCAYADVSGTFSYTASEKPATQPTQPTTPVNSSYDNRNVTYDGMALALTALTYSNATTPYVLGGNSLTTGTDCSGFTKLIYAQYGINLPRTAAAVWDMPGQFISLDEALPGDILVDDPAKYVGTKFTGHVGIYLGGGWMIDMAPANAAGTEGGICINLASWYPQAKRIANNTASKTAGDGHVWKALIENGSIQLDWGGLFRERNSIEVVGSGLGEGGYVFYGDPSSFDGKTYDAWSWINWNSTERPNDPSYIFKMNYDAVKNLPQYTWVPAEEAGEKIILPLN